MQIGAATHLVRYCKQQLIGSAINSIVNVATLVQTNGFRGDHWLRMIAMQVTLTFRGNETIEDDLVPFYWVLVLPTQMVASLCRD